MYGGHITDDWDRRLCKVCLIRKAGPMNYIFHHVRIESNKTPLNYFYIGISRRVYASRSTGWGIAVGSWFYESSKHGLCQLSLLHN